MECIVLAGGLGTRLRGVINDLPKCMAPVNGKPFLFYLFRFLEKQNCSRVLLSLGYKHEKIVDWLKEGIWAFDVDYVVEKQSLGTGGAVSLASQQCKEACFFVMNGDSFFDIDLRKMNQFHREHGADTTIALKPMQHFERYGSVQMKDEKIISFEEKKFCEAGLINAGIYLLQKNNFRNIALPEKFSFEKNYLEKHLDDRNIAGFVGEGYFIDIGVPEDYQKAQEDFKNIFK